MIGRAAGEAASRVMTEETADGVRLRLPGPRNRWALPGLALLVPIAAYLVLGNAVFVDFAVLTAANDRSVATAAMIGVLALIVLVTDLPVAVAAVVLLYHAFGREVVTASPWMLTDTRGLPLLSRHRRWAAQRVSGLRVSAMSGGPADTHEAGRRGILFEVDRKRTRSIAEGCTPAETAEAFEAINGALTRPTVTREGRS